MAALNESLQYLLTKSALLLFLYNLVLLDGDLKWNIFKEEFDHLCKSEICANARDVKAPKSSIALSQNCMTSLSASQDSQNVVCSQYSIH